VKFELSTDVIGNGAEDESTQSTSIEVGFGASYDPLARTAGVEADGEVNADLLRAEVTAGATVSATITTDLELVDPTGSLEAGAELKIPSLGPLPLSIPIPETDVTIGLQPTIEPGIDAEFRFTDELDFEDGTVSPDIGLEITIGKVIEWPLLGLNEVGLEVSALGTLAVAFDVGTDNRNLRGDITLSGESVLATPGGKSTLEGTLLRAEFGDGGDTQQTTVGSTTNRERQVTVSGPNPPTETANRLETTASGAQTTNRLTDRTYEDLQPTVAGLGSDTYVVAWRFHDENKAAAAGRDITVRRFENDSATATTRITNDTTNDTSPIATALDDGRILLMWTKHTFDATDQAFDAEAYFDSAEIAYSIYDGESWSEPQQLTDTTRTQQRPTIAAAGDEWLLAWQSIDDAQPATDVRVAQINPDGTMTELGTRSNAANPDTSARQDGSVDLTYCAVDSGATTGVTHERLDGGTVVGSDQYSAANVQDVVIADGRLVCAIGSGEAEPNLSTPATVLRTI